MSLNGQIQIEFYAIALLQFRNNVVAQSCITIYTRKWLYVIGEKLFEHHRRESIAVKQKQTWLDVVKHNSKCSDVIETSLNVMKTLNRDQTRLLTIIYDHKWTYSLTNVVRARRQTWLNLVNRQWILSNMMHKDQTRIIVILYDQIWNCTSTNGILEDRASKFRRRIN